MRTLEELCAALGDRRASICRELTKKYETVFQTTLAEAVAYYREHEPRGECVIVIEGRAISEIKKEGRKTWQSMSVEEHMEYYISQGYEKKAAMKQVAEDRGISRRDVYQALL